MVEADGCFHIYLKGLYASNDSLIRGRVICQFELVQRKIDEASNLSCLPFMTEIANIFQCNIRYKGDNAIFFMLQENNKHYMIKSYFDKFPLMSSKYLNYLCYIKGLNYLGKRLTNKEILEIRDIKNSMNNKRTYYN
jgi:hypothetical protein